MRWTQGLHRGWTNTLRAAVVLGSVALLAMLLLTVTEIVWRALGGRTIPGLIGSIEILLTIVVAGSLAFALRKGQHVEFTLLMDRVSAPTSAVLQGGGLVLVGLFLAFVAYESGLVALRSYVTGEFRGGLIHVPLWPGRAALSVGMGLLALECLVSGLRLLGKARV